MVTLWGESSGREREKNKQICVHTHFLPTVKVCTVRGGESTSVGTLLVLIKAWPSSRLCTQVTGALSLAALHIDY